MTLIDEFYKVGPGPSSSHTIGPMRITYDFYQRATKLPAAQLAEAQKFRVNLFGSLSATGKGHGTERASLAGLTGMEPATTDPAFLDGLAADPTQVFQVKLGAKEIPVSLAGRDLRRDQGRVPSPEHDARLPARRRRQGPARAGILLGRRRLHRVEGLYAAREGRAEVSLRDDGRDPRPCQRDNITLAQLAMANETTISGRSEAEINAFLDKIIGRCGRREDRARGADERAPGADQAQDQGRRRLQKRDQQESPARPGIGVVSAAALRDRGERARAPGDHRRRRAARPG
jgi:L-serine dehydratase